MSGILRMRLAIAGILLAFASSAALAQNTVRPDVGKPLKAAEALIKSGKAREALAKVNEADAVPNKTAYESLLVQQMRGSAAHAAGDYASAIKSFEAVVSSGKLSGKEQLAMVEAIAVDYYKLKDYANAAKWSQRYFKEGGTAPAMRTVQLQSYYLGNDCASVNRMLGDESRKPGEDELQILRSCYRKQNDQAGYVAATEKLILYYPKKEYWKEMLARVQRKPGFSDRLSIHVYKLRLAVGDFASANDYMEFAQLALQDGVPGEAKMVMDKGYAAGVLGKGDQAARQARLRALVDKSLEDARKNRAQAEKEAEAQKSGDDLVKVGLDYAYDGHADKGIALIQKGIKKGGLKRAEDAKLRLGEAQLQAGHKDRAVQTLKGVHGNDGTADLARLWVLEARA
jgi:outer membrane protein assembly factor BamD (BamD/ComL family)